MKVTATRLRIAAVLGLATLLMLAVFGTEGRAAVQTWIDSTAYGHCFFVLPIALFLAWERRAVIAATPISPLPWIGLLVLPLGLVWLVTERIGIMEGQQLTAFASLQILIFAAIGSKLYRALAVPLLYLVFLIPFGAFITPLLQSFTAWFIDVGLDVLGIAHFSDGNVVDIAAGRFFVAEACAGLRFLIASIAFGALYACMIYRSPGKRVAFIAASIVIPVIANGFRALGIVTLGDILGSAEAAAVDHVLYGWIFFSVVILLLIAAGLPFREDDVAVPVPAPAADAPRALPRAVLATLLTLGLITIAPAWTIWTEHQGSATALEPGSLIGCMPQAAPRAPGQHWRYACPVMVGAIDHLEFRVDVLPLHSNAGALLRQRHAIIDDVDAESSDVRTLDEHANVHWLQIGTHEPDLMAVIASWTDGAPTRGGWQERLARARHSIWADTPPPLLISIATPPETKILTQSQMSQINQALHGLILRNRGFVDDLVQANAVAR